MSISDEASRFWKRREQAQESSRQNIRLNLISIVNYLESLEGDSEVDSHIYYDIKSATERMRTVVSYIDSKSPNPL